MQLDICSSILPPNVSFTIMVGRYNWIKGVILLTFCPLISQETWSTALVSREVIRASSRSRRLSALDVTMTSSYRTVGTAEYKYWISLESFSIRLDLREVVRGSYRDHQVWPQTDTDIYWSQIESTTEYRWDLRLDHRCTVDVASLMDEFNDTHMGMALSPKTLVWGCWEFK